MQKRSTRREEEYATPYEKVPQWISGDVFCPYTKSLKTLCYAIDGLVGYVKAPKKIL